MLTPAQKAAFARANADREFKAWVEQESAKAAAALRSAVDTHLLFRAQGRSAVLDEILTLMKTSGGT